jgi:hypothetical protein
VVLGSNPSGITSKKKPSHEAFSFLYVLNYIHAICFWAPGKSDSVAQLVEHYTFNVVVLGSNPSGITSDKAFKTIDFEGFIVLI